MVYNYKIGFFSVQSVPIGKCFKLFYLLNIYLLNYKNLM